MSESVTTNTKTFTESNVSESTDGPWIIQDRWSNNINYRQLVVSSCIGVFQLTWNPYLHDLRRLVPFLFLYNVFSMVVAYPMFYLELAIGVVTKKSVLNCWDLSPAARGIGFSMVTCGVWSALAATALASRSLALLVHSLHSFLPWLHCAAAAAPPCAARHRPLPEGAETPAHSFYYNFVLGMKRDGLETGLGKVVWELATYFIISCFVIYLIAVKRIYSYSKLVLFKDVLAYFVLTTCAIGALRLEGWRAVIHHCDWSSLFEGCQIWREALEYALLEMAVSQGSLVMLGSYLPKEPHRLGRTALAALLASKTTCMGSNMVLASALGALHADYDTSGETISVPGGSAASMILWADYVARVPGSQFWSALVFFTLFVLAVSTAALLIQTLMSTLTGRSIKKIAWAFLLMTCLMFAFLGVITLCTQGGQYVLDFIIKWPVCIPRVFIAASVSFVITYVYGQTTFCEDVFFAVGEYPNLYMRVCWALSPILLVIIFLLGIGSWPAEGATGWLLVAFTLKPIFIVAVIYLVFKFRVRNIVHSGK